MAWLSYERIKVRKRQAAIAAIKKLDGGVIYGESQTFRPAWLRALLGDDSGEEVVSVWFDNNSTVTDATLVHLGNLNHLERLLLEKSQVTDAGLVHLKGLTNLKWLMLDNTQITDAGLVHLSGLTKLERLWLVETQVTNSGVAKLQLALPNVRITR